MLSFVEHFESGKLAKLATEINASLLTDIKKLFSVQYSALWIGSTGEDELRKLIVEYEVIKQTNILLNVSAHNKDGAFDKWRDTLKFIGFSCESVRAKKPALDKLFYQLLKIANREDMLPDNMKSLLDELLMHNAEIRDVLNNTLGVFSEIYAPYLEGFSAIEIEEIRNSITVDMFTATSTQSNVTVRDAAKSFKDKQIKTQLMNLWKQNASGTKNPREWSAKYQTPILACIPEEYYSDAKRAFAIINAFTQSEADIKFALTFLESVTYWNDLASESYRNNCFMNMLVGEYAAVLPDISVIRSELDKLAIDAYDWLDSPVVKGKVKSMASAEYYAGGSDEAEKFIEDMSADELKKRLKALVQKDIELGIKIIINGRK